MHGMNFQSRNQPLDGISHFHAALTKILAMIERSQTIQIWCA